MFSVFSSSDEKGFSMKMAFFIRIRAYLRYGESGGRKASTLYQNLRSTYPPTSSSVERAEVASNAGQRAKKQRVVSNDRRAASDISAHSASLEFRTQKYN